MEGHLSGALSAICPCQHVLSTWPATQSIPRMLWLFSFEKTLIMQCPHLRRYPTCQGTITPVGQRAQPTEHHLAIRPALQRNSLTHFESPSQLHFGYQDARVSSLPVTIRFREDPHVVSPSWGNSLCCSGPGAQQLSVIRCPLEHPPSNQLGLQTHKESDSLSFGQEDIA